MTVYGESEAEKVSGNLGGAVALRYAVRDRIRIRIRQRNGSGYSVWTSLRIKYDYHIASAVILYPVYSLHTIVMISTEAYVVHEPDAGSS